MGVTAVKICLRLFQITFTEKKASSFKRLLISQTTREEFRLWQVFQRKPQAS